MVGLQVKNKSIIPKCLCSESVQDQIYCILTRLTIIVNSSTVNISFSVSEGQAGKQGQKLKQFYHCLWFRIMSILSLKVKYVRILKKVIKRLRQKLNLAQHKGYKTLILRLPGFHGEKGNQKETHSICNGYSMVKNAELFYEIFLMQNILIQFIYSKCLLNWQP